MNSQFDDNNELSFSDKLKLYSVYLLKKFCIIISSLLFTIIIEKIIFSILSYILYFTLLAIILQILLHLFLIRFLVLKVIYYLMNQNLSKKLNIYILYKGISEIQY